MPHVHGSDPLIHGNQGSHAFLETLVKLKPCVMFLTDMSHPLARGSPHPAQAVPNSLLHS